MCSLHFAASEPDADSGHFQIAVAPLSEAAKLPRGPQRALLVAAATSIATHPVTGAFADPTHESAFAAQFFRLAFPCHAFLMALMGACMAWIGAQGTPPVRALWSTAALMMMLGLVGRVLVHRMDDTVRGQRIGSWGWTLLAVLAFISDMCGLWTNPLAICVEIARLIPAYPLYSLLFAVVNGSHGMGFVHKVALCGLMLVEIPFSFAVCPSPPPPSPQPLTSPPPPELCVTVAYSIGFVLAHMAEMLVRHSYVEKERLAEATTWEQRLEEERQEKKLDGETRRLEERNEQLRAEKERLLYDVQRRDRPLDDDGDRSAIRRGLQAEPSQPHLLADGTDSSETGAPAPSDALPPSLPPGPPSSSSSDATKSSKASQSSAAGTRPAPPPPTWAELDAYYIAEMAATSATEQGAVWDHVWDPSSTAGAPSSQLEALNFKLGRPAVPPPSWAELAYRRHYAKLAAKSATEQGVPPGAQSSTSGESAAPPLTWAEFNDALRKTKSCYAENAYRQPTEVAPAIARAEASQQPQGQDGEQ